MYPYYPYTPRVNPFISYSYQAPQPYYTDHRSYGPYPYFMDRQQTVRGQATWTEGGQVTQCGIPWSNNQYMTVAVGENSPYQCGQSLKVKDLSSQREVIVTVVDQVLGYPPNKINLHRKAFEALGANLDTGVITVEITPSPELEQEKWGKYLLEVVQTAYPSYNITNYDTVSKTQVSSNQIKETYEYILQSSQEKITVQGNVIYNSNTDRVISFDIKEV